MSASTHTSILSRWSIPFSKSQIVNGDFSTNRENATLKRFFFVSAESPSSISALTPWQSRLFSLGLEAKASSCRLNFELLDSRMYSRAGKQLTLILWMSFAKRSRSVRVEDPPDSPQLKALSLFRDRLTALIAGRELSISGENVWSLLLFRSRVCRPMSPSKALERMCEMLLHVRFRKPRTCRPLNSPPFRKTNWFWLKSRFFSSGNRLNDPGGTTWILFLDRLIAVRLSGNMLTTSVRLAMFLLKHHMMSVGGKFWEQPLKPKPQQAEVLSRSRNRTVRTIFTRRLSLHKMCTRSDQRNLKMC